MLKVKNSFINDTSITSIQNQVYTPYAVAFNNQDEIRIVIQSQNSYLLPHESSLYIEGNVVVAPPENEQIAPPNPNIIRNFAAFLFDSIRYELNGVEIDRAKNVGITTLLKNYASLTSVESRTVAASSWVDDMSGVATVFALNIPLKLYLGFVEDYKKIIMSMKHELILTRSRNDTNCFHGTNDNLTISISKVQWRMPHVKVDDYTQIKMLKQLESNEAIPMIFRSWDLYEYPVLPITTKQVWCVKTSTNLASPRFIILGLQTERNNQITKNMTHFDHCNVIDAKVYLNTECYPQESINTHFGSGRAAILYEMYTKFQESYYHDGSKTPSDPFMSLASFLSHPIFVFDCSRQNELVKNSSVDIRIEFQTSENIPANTAAYCLVIHDNIISYNPLTNVVTKNV
jgi:hypothetical protein